MKNLNILASLVLVISLMASTSCKKKSDNPDEGRLSYKDVIIGCKTGQPITMGVDPINGNIFNFNTSLGNASVTGPSCLNSTKDFYYSAGDDKMIDEVEVATGKVKRSFQTNNYTSMLHYRASDNSLIYAQGVVGKKEFAVFKIDLNSGQTSSLFTFASEYGMGIRTSFIRNNGLYFMNGMAELRKVDLSTGDISTVSKLTKVTNSLAYDNKLDKVFYLASPNASDFSLFCYTFSDNTDVLLKNFPDIKTHLMGSTTYNPGNNNYYFYNASNERITINVVSLDKKTDKVKCPLINTEIVNCTVKQEDIHEN
jgi:hypothetical protein